MGRPGRVGLVATHVARAPGLGLYLMSSERQAGSAVKLAPGGNAPRSGRAIVPCFIDNYDMGLDRAE